MDANGTKFHLLLGRDDWSRCSPPPGSGSRFHWNESAQTLTLQPQIFRFQAGARDVAPAVSNRRGAARDRFGSWYWIDTNTTTIRVLSSGSGTVTDFWSTELARQSSNPHRSGDFADIEEQVIHPMPLAGLAITEDHYLVAGTLKPAGVLIFDLHNPGGPQQIEWPADIDFEPFDMAQRAGGGVWILDRTHRRFWALDRNFNIGAAKAPPKTPGAQPPKDFVPTNPEEASDSIRPVAVLPLSVDLASPVGATDPVSIEGLRDGTVLILDGALPTRSSPPQVKFSRIYHHCFGRQLGDPLTTDVMTALMDETTATNLNFVVYDIAVVSGAKRMYAVAADGNQAFVFELAGDGDQLRLNPVEDFYPLRLFGGKAIVAAGANAFYDIGEMWLPLVAQARPRFVHEATLETPVFDSGEPDCVWHRLMLDACIPHDAHIDVWSKSANTRDGLPDVEWQNEPSLHRRGNGSELPFTGTEETWELLFQRAQGRFLKLKMQLVGSGRTSPHVRALRAYDRRFSYLKNYLPAVYREDEQSASFLDRFLANFEGFFTALEDKIAAVQMLFEVRNAPAETLDWLAGWLGVSLDPTWPEAKRRLFIRYAMDFFQYRGTAHGIKIALHLALSECADETLFETPWQLPPRANGIRIVEKYRTRRTPSVALGDPTEMARPRQIGPEELNRWQAFEKEKAALTPPAQPADPEIRRWQDFLARRYQRVSALNVLHRTKYLSFAAVPMPSSLPLEGPALTDWFHFQGVVTAMHRTAHRFTVLLPMPKSGNFQQNAQQERLALAERIIHLEKPAHTVFDIKFYWAFFRLGEARLGEDTVIDLGSRSPEFLPTMKLDNGYIGQSLLAPNHKYQGEAS